MRTVAEIEAEYDAARDETKAALARERGLLTELNVAKVNAAAPPLPVDTKVKRTIPSGWGSRSTQRTQRGSVAVFDPSVHRGLRGLYDVKAGDAIVVSTSGATGYRFIPGRYDKQVSWEIDE